MQHADKLIERIIFLDGFSNMQTLESLHIDQTVKEVVDRDLQAEMDDRLAERFFGRISEELLRTPCSNS